MKIGYATNEYGTSVTKYWCDTCGEEYTVCPSPENDDEWNNCLSPDCPSYDSGRDIDKIFDTDAEIYKEKIYHC